MCGCQTIPRAALSPAGRTLFGASARHLPFSGPKLETAAFEFDLQSRTVCVRVGGPGLFEQIEEPTTLAEEDEPDDDGALVSTDDVRIRFEAPAVLRKWPSINQQRVVADGGQPYLLVDGTLDDCIQQFMAKPANQHHLYEIHTEPQGELVRAVLSAKHIIEIARLRDLL
jgi:hypothetical protein